MFTVDRTSGSLHSEFVHLHFYRLIGKLTVFLQFHLTQSNNQFHDHRSAFSSKLKYRVGFILPKTADLRITLNIDGTPILYLLDHTLTLHTLKPLVS